MSLGSTSALAAGLGTEWFLRHLLLLMQQAAVSNILLRELLFKPVVLGAADILRRWLDLILLLQHHQLLLLLKQGLELLLVELIQEFFAEYGHLDEILSLVRSRARDALVADADLLLEWQLGWHGRLTLKLYVLLGVSS